jgi:hypothetical protein
VQADVVNDKAPTFCVDPEVDAATFGGILVVVHFHVRDGVKLLARP